MSSTTSDRITVKQWPEVLAMLGNLPRPPRRTLCFGKAGTGKTTYAVSLHPESERITLTAGMFADALFGKFLLRDGSTFYADAAATRAGRKGVPLVIDEIHMGGSELDAALHTILDDPAIARFNLDNGETIEPAQGYRVVATMNGSPDQLKDTVLDRFDIVIRCDTPHTGILKRLSPESAAFLANKMANEPMTAPDWVPDISPRRMLQFEDLRGQGVPDSLAADIMFGEGQGKTVLMSIMDAARNSLK